MNADKHTYRLSKDFRPTRPAVYSEPPCRACLMLPGVMGHCRCS